LGVREEVLHFDIPVEPKGRVTLKRSHEHD
jgi:hypothetical protein